MYNYQKTSQQYSRNWQYKTVTTQRSVIYSNQSDLIQWLHTKINKEEKGERERDRERERERKGKSIELLVCLD